MSRSIHLDLGFLHPNMLKNNLSSSRNKFLSGKRNRALSGGVLALSDFNEIKPIVFFPKLQ